MDNLSFQVNANIAVDVCLIFLNSFFFSFSSLKRFTSVWNWLIGLIDDSKKMVTQIKSLDGLSKAGL